MSQSNHLENKSYSDSEILVEFYGMLSEKRFIDDVFFLFIGSAEDLDRLKLLMNAIHDTIKFTFESSKEKINFLELSISILNNQFHTSIYTNHPCLKERLF